MRGRSDFSWSKPSRRSGAVIFPGMIEPLPKIVVIIDTSGSIQKEELSAYVGQVDAILKQMGVSWLQVISVDAEVQVSKPVRFAREVISKKMLVGGGGTDMCLGIEEAEKMKADICVVLTDGFSPWPENPPRVKTFVYLSSKRGLCYVPDFLPTFVGEVPLDS
jgi:predicted metal-dependent peptidase